MRGYLERHNCMVLKKKNSREAVVRDQAVCFMLWSACCLSGQHHRAVIVVHVFVGIWEMKCDAEDVSTRCLASVGS